MEDRTDKYRDRDYREYRDKSDRDFDKYKIRERERERDNKSSKKKYKNRSRSRHRSKSRSRSRSRDKSRNKESPSSQDRSRKRQKRSKTRSKSNSVKKEILNKTEESHQHQQSQQSKFTADNKITKSKSSNFSFNGPSDMMQNSQTSNISANSQGLQAIALAQAAKVDRKLYIGNLPNGITPPTLVKLLNAAISALKANTAPGDPVLSAWISTDGHYAFVEFRSAEEANNGFQLNNIQILGQPLKVGRPKTYTGSLSMMEDGHLCNTVGAALQAGTMSIPVEGKKVQFPSKIICFKGITKGINIENEEEYNEVVLDIKEECSRFGRVISVFMPRKDVEDNPSPGMGNAYVEFQTLEEAKEVRKNMVGRKFNNRSVLITYFSEENYAKRDFRSDDPSHEE